MPVNYNKRIFYYIVDEGKTIREVANILGVSKSTLHCYIHNVMWKSMDDESYSTLCQTLKHNFDTKHTKGGLATREKWHKIKQRNEGNMNGYIKR